MRDEAANQAASLIDSLGALLQYGLLGLSAILVILGFVLFYKTVSAETVSEQRYKASRFFLVFSLVFLLAAAGVKLADDAVNPQARIRVEIEPWDDNQLARFGIERNFFIKHVGRRKYSGEALEENVGSGSKIECSVYPLYAKVEQLTRQLALSEVAASKDAASSDLGIAPLGPRND